ncbi:DNA mismatch repair protein MutS [Eubacteriales bacterium KG127]
MKLSPMMEQYMGIKEQYPDCVIFYRLGDFYELFFDDALEISKVLELTLTGRNCGLEEKAPMCGVPFHSASGYISRLVSKGYKVAICEQTEDPASAKGIVKREVVRIVTPGTNTIDDSGESQDNNYLSAFYFDGKCIQLAYVDISTGELYATSCDYVDETNFEDFFNEINKLDISEILVNETLSELLSENELKSITGAFVSVKSDSYFAPKASEEGIKSQFKTSSLSSLGIESGNSPISALGGLLAYLRETQKHQMDHITRLKIYTMGSNMILDKATLRNLELTETLYDKTLKGSLLYVLDKTKTAHGSRVLKQWLREPLNDADLINLRLDAVEELFSFSSLRNDLRAELSAIYDFQRLTGKIASGSLNGKDMIALRNSLVKLPKIKSIISSFKSTLLENLYVNINLFEDIEIAIGKAIKEDAPITLKDGGIIKNGYSEDLDNLNHSIKDGKEWIASLEQIERDRTGIKNLKVGYNKIFGYFIEINKSQIDKVPDEYIRKQTLVNNERYITPKMKDIESVVLNGQEKINKLEYTLFDDLRKSLIPHISALQQTAIALATLDVLASLAYVAEKNGYTKPLIDESRALEIYEGRHPVIENMENGLLFVSNDVNLDQEKNFMAIITGPNMAGKSTYMRQTALIVLMGQIGSFVPADSAHIGVVDRIFTRIGASDNLSQGQSTFYVEMSELAYIMSSATSKSLLILDEIGRGTSTYDGMSIAFATVNYLCKPNRKVRTMFATHYHELTILADQIYGIINLNVDVVEEAGNIVFLHKIVEGVASQSYGIHVAKLAGVPKELLIDASSKLSELEKSSVNINDNKMEKREQQLSFLCDESEDAFSNLSLKLIENELENLNLDNIRPSEAYGILERIQDIIKDN